MYIFVVSQIVTFAKFSLRKIPKELFIVPRKDLKNKYDNTFFKAKKTTNKDMRGRIANS